jgi:sugar-specific transcriptional regulator TrmB
MDDTISQLRKWLNREINSTKNQLKTLKRFPKATHEGYLHGLKMTYSKIDELIKKEV